MLGCSRTRSERGAMFSTNIVDGDTKVQVRDLHIGDKIRSFSGFEDTTTITDIKDLGLFQGLIHKYLVTFSDGWCSDRCRGDETYYLATGPARKEEEW